MRLYLESFESECGLPPGCSRRCFRNIALGLEKANRRNRRLNLGEGLESGHHQRVCDNQGFRRALSSGLRQALASRAL